MEYILTASNDKANYGMHIVDAAHNTMAIDIPPNQGGEGKGMRPMQTLLAALVGCCNVDIVMILNKQKQPFNSLKIVVEAQREEHKDLAMWEKIHLHFSFVGGLALSKAERAVQLSIEKYCSVSETLRRAGASITYTVEVV
jgi:putative redox protein